MSDDLENSYKRHLEALSRTNALNKTAVFDALAAANATTVNVKFDGEGDGGQIEEVSLFVGLVSTPLPEVQIEIQHVSWGSEEVLTHKTSLQEAIETLCYDFLSQEHDGWENNDGAFGEFVFDVEKRRIELDFNGRYSDYVNHSHTF